MVVVEDKQCGADRRPCERRVLCGFLWRLYLRCPRSGRNILAVYYMYESERSVPALSKKRDTAIRHTASKGVQQGGL